jgi:hypothetical protein
LFHQIMQPVAVADPSGKGEAAPNWYFTAAAQQQSVAESLSCAALWFWHCVILRGHCAVRNSLELLLANCPISYH